MDNRIVAYRPPVAYAPLPTPRASLGLILATCRGRLAWAWRRWTLRRRIDAEDRTIADYDHWIAWAFREGYPGAVVAFEQDRSDHVCYRDTLKRSLWQMEMGR